MAREYIKTDKNGTRYYRELHTATVAEILQAVCIL